MTDDDLLAQADHWVNQSDEGAPLSLVADLAGALRARDAELATAQERGESWKAKAHKAWDDLDRQTNRALSAEWKLRTRQASTASAPTEREATVPDEREVPLRVVDERDERRHAVAFALFAGPDATYIAGVYRPSQVELQLAERLLETLETVGWTVRRHPEPPPQPLHDRCQGVRAVAASESTCICKRFRDTGGYRIADLTCPVHGVDGTDPGDGYWDDEPVGSTPAPEEP